MKEQNALDELKILLTFEQEARLRGSTTSYVNDQRIKDLRKFLDELTDIKEEQKNV